MKRTLLLMAGSCLAAQLMAGELIGVVKDKKTGEVLIGSTVQVKELPNVATTSGLDGSFVLKGIENRSKVTLICHYLGYASQEVVVSTTESVPTVIELESKGVDLGAVTVSAHRRQDTDLSARQLEMKSLGVMNVMSAQSIRLSPDIDVAGVIQRMSGVVMDEGSAGEGKYAVLRGMDKRYNYSLVNGVKIASPDNKERYVPLDLFPSELMDRLEVTKSLTPDMEGDATGGVINMVMKDAPTTLRIQADAAVGYNSIYFNRDLASVGNNITMTAPREAHGADYKASMSDFSKATSQLSYARPLPDLWLSLSGGRRFLDDRLGLMLAGSYQNMNRATNSLFYTDAMSQVQSTVHVTDQRKREYSEQLQQWGAHAKLDFVPAYGHKIEWYNAYIGSRSDQVREMTITDLSLDYNPELGNYTKTYQTRARRTLQGIFSSTLKGTHQLGDNWDLDWAGVYGHATGKRPDNTYINLESDVHSNIEKVTADNAERRWEHNTDRDWTGIINLKWHTRAAGGLWEAKVGGLYRNKRRENRYVSYSFVPATATRPVQGVDFNTLDEINWKVDAVQGSVNALNYDAGEDIGAAYVMGRFENSRWNVTAGVRAEHTDQQYTMLYPPADEDPHGEQRYWDILPSLHLKYTLRKGMFARASYFRSINRPGFFEIVPYTIIEEDYTEYGNKDLKHAVIDNVDLRWEWMPNHTDQLMAGFFYKHIQNPIESAYYSKNSRQFGYGPANLGDADNWGFELDFTKYFRSFGVKANYTYTHSSITTPKTVYGRDASGKLTRTEVQQTRTLVGQAPHVANLSLLYRGANNGWEGQLTGSYISERLTTASHYYNSDYYDAPRFTLGCSVEKKWNNFSVFFKGSNLLNSVKKVYIKTHNDANDGFEGQNMDGKTLIKRDTSGIELMLGVHYNL